jgi:hypothetical protein
VALSPSSLDAGVLQRTLLRVGRKPETALVDCCPAAAGLRVGPRT